MAGSEELMASTRRISSLMYARNLRIPNPAMRAIMPSTINTNRIDVMYNVPISLTSGPSEETPYLPIVNARAPKAPIGAKCMRIFTIPNTASVNRFKKSKSGFDRGPAIESAKPNRTETSSTCRISPLVKASTTVLGMRCNRKSETLCAFPCPA